MKKFLSIAVIAASMAVASFSASAGCADGGNGFINSGGNCYKGGEGGGGGAGGVGNGGRGGNGGSANQGQAQGQLQGQLQGQGQAQGQIGINRSNNRNANRNANSNANRNSNRNSANGLGLGVGIGGDQRQGQVGIVKGGNTRVDASSRNSNSNRSRNNNSASNEGNNTSVDASDNSVYRGDEAQKRNPVSSAFAAPLTTSNDTCMGSSSVAGQGVSFGLGFGSTWTDEDCVIRKDARLIHNMGDAEAARALMCLKDNVKVAYAAAGHPCPEAPTVEAQAEYTAQAESISTTAKTQNGIDPFATNWEDF